MTKKKLVNVPAGTMLRAKHSFSSNLDPEEWDLDLDLCELQYGVNKWHAKDTVIILIKNSYLRSDGLHIKYLVNEDIQAANFPSGSLDYFFEVVE